jgi:hypothetical protein
MSGVKNANIIAFEPSDDDLFHLRSFGDFCSNPHDTVHFPFDEGLMIAVFLVWGDVLMGTPCSTKPTLPTMARGALDPIACILFLDL